jgi:hypothetical protein
MVNFATEGWMGHRRSLHLQRNKDQLLQFTGGESDPDVRPWIEEYVTALDKDIEAERVEEERDANTPPLFREDKVRSRNGQGVRTLRRPELHQNPGLLRS